MCEHVQKPDGTDGVLILCATTGKPITITNELGMFCEDECDKAECEEARDRGLAFIGAFTRQMADDG
jgi:hypothetical protein